MVTLRYVGNAGRYRLTGSDVDVAQGETVTVDDETAEYLQANGEFEPVEDGEDNEASIDGFSFHDGGVLADLNVSEVKSRLETGEYDHVLEDIKSAEKHGKDRSTVYDAVDARLED